MTADLVGGTRTLRFAAKSAANPLAQIPPMKKSSRKNSAGKGSPKKTTAKKAKRAVKRPVGLAAAVLAEISPTLARVLKIISSYGIVPAPAPSTIVGPAVPSMGKFTQDVNE